MSLPMLDQVLLMLSQETWALNGGTHTLKAALPLGRLCDVSAGGHALLQLRRERSQAVLQLLCADILQVTVWRHSPGGRG